MSSNGKNIIELKIFLLFNSSIVHVAFVCLDIDNFKKKNKNSAVQEKSKKWRPSRAVSNLLKLFVVSAFLLGCLVCL